MIYQQQEEYIEEKKVHEGELFKIEGKDQALPIHRSICAITYLDSKSRLNSGSGVLISRNLVLTSAHNIFDKDSERQYSRLTFYQSQNGLAKKPIKIQAFKILPQYKTCQKIGKLQHDYALLKLNESAHIDTFPKLKIPCQKCLMNEQSPALVQIYGYPVEYENFKQIDKYGGKRLFQYGQSRQNCISFIEPFYKIGYQINTLGGQSGCPIIHNQSIIGIHNGAGKESEKFNIGRLITKDVLQNIKKWAKQMKAEEFEEENSVCQHEPSPYLIKQQQKILYREEDNFQNYNVIVKSNLKLDNKNCNNSKQRQKQSKLDCSQSQLTSNTTENQDFINQNSCQQRQHGSKLKQFLGLRFTP